MDIFRIGKSDWKYVVSMFLIVIAIEGWLEWVEGRVLLTNALLWTTPSIVFVLFFENRKPFAVMSFYTVAGVGIFRGIILPDTFLPNLRFIIPSLIIGGLLHFLFLRFRNEKELLSDKFFDEEEQEKPIFLDLREQDSPSDETPLSSDADEANSIKD